METTNSWGCLPGLSDFLGSPVRLVKFIDQSHPFRYASVQKDEEVALDHNREIRYQDSGTIMLMNSVSIDDLNSRIADRSSHTTFRNFRPNIYAQLNSAYEEDKIKLWTIGDVTFESIRPCTRCTFTTVNPDSGIKNKDSEPFNTLKTYRMFKGSETPVIGVQMSPLQQGRIKLGDYVEERQSS